MRGPSRPCSVPGCPNLVTGRTAQCQEHRARADKIKGSPEERGYDSAWRRIRARHLRLHPWCVVCHRIATEVDHIDGNPWNRAPSNLRSLCGLHHRQRTARDQPGGARG